MLSETKLYENMLSSELKVDGYDLIEFRCW